MAQLERSGRATESPQTPRTSPISGHLLMAEQKIHISPTQGIYHNEETDHNFSNSKRSVLSKVKEEAMKLKHSLSGRKKHESEQPSPSPSSPPIPTLTPPQARDVSNDENANRELEGESEYFGAPMYESEAAPEALKESARQHPRAEPVLPENHKFPNTTKSDNEDLTILTSDLKQETNFPTHTQNASPAQITALPKNTEDSNQYGASTLHKQDKGPNASGKEHSTNKVQPKEHESAVSHGKSSVVDKVKDSVYSMLEMSHQKPSESKAKSENVPTSMRQNRSSMNANTANAQEEVIEEQNHGKILQAN